MALSLTIARPKDRAKSIAVHLRSTADALISRVTEGHAGLGGWPRVRNTRTETATVSLTERSYERVLARCGWPTNQAHIV